MATGIQEKFSFKDVGLAALSGGVGAGLRGVIKGAGALASAARGAAGSAISQGIGVATGLQQSFSWAGVAAAGVGGGVSGQIGDSLGTGFGGKLATNTASAIANAATRSAIDGSNFDDNLMAAIPDVIGQAIGNEIGGALVAQTTSRVTSSPVDRSAVSGAVTYGGSPAGVDEIVSYGTRNTVDTASIAALMNRVNNSIDGLWGRSNVSISDINTVRPTSISNSQFNLNLGGLSYMDFVDSPFGAWDDPYVSWGLIEAQSGLSLPQLDFAGGALRYGAENTTGILSDSLGYFAAGIEGTELGLNRIRDSVINIFTNPIETLQGLALVGGALNNNYVAQGYLMAGAAQGIDNRMSVYGAMRAHSDIEGLIRITTADATQLTGEALLAKGAGTGISAIAKGRQIAQFDFGAFGFDVRGTFSKNQYRTIELKSGVELDRVFNLDIGNIESAFLTRQTTLRKVYDTNSARDVLALKGTSDIFPDTITSFRVNRPTTALIGPINNGNGFQIVVNPKQLDNLTEIQNARRPLN